MLSFLNVDKTFEIETTYRCNWNCSYCSVKTHTKSILPHKDILENFRIKTNDYKDIEGGTLIISGGEPAIVNKDLLLKFVDLSKRYKFKLHINTNGAMFNSPILHYFKQINWHVSENLLWSYKISELVKKLPTNVLPLIVITNDNFWNLEKFLNNWPENIKLLMIPASDPQGKEIYFDDDLYNEVLKFKKYMTKESQLIFLSKNKVYNERESKITYIENYIKD